MRFDAEGEYTCRRRCRRLIRCELKEAEQSCRSLESLLKLQAEEIRGGGRHMYLPPPKLCRQMLVGQ